MLGGRRGKRWLSTSLNFYDVRRKRSCKITSRSALSILLSILTGPREQGSLLAAITDVPLTEVGLIVTCGRSVPNKLFQGRYVVTDLREIGRIDRDRLTIERSRLGAYIKAKARGARDNRGSVGRPPVAAIVCEAYARRRSKEKEFVSIAEEARQIKQDIRRNRPDLPAPGFSTIRKHVSRLRSES
jgi:hypothetical protein